MDTTGMMDTVDTKKEELILRYEPMLYGHLHKLGFWNMLNLRKNKIILDDFLQEGYLAILKADETFDPNKGTRFRTYVYQVTRNTFITYARVQGIFRSNYAEVPYQETFNVDSETAEELMLEDDMLKLMKQSNHFEVLRDYFIFDKTQKQIAEQQGCSQQWVSEILSKFRKQVKEVWS